MTDRVSGASQQRVKDLEAEEAARAEEAKRARPASTATREPEIVSRDFDPLFLANLAVKQGQAAPANDAPVSTLDAGLDALAHTAVARGHSVGDYLSTLDGNGPKDLRPLTKALSIEKVSREDARVFAATGALPDAGGISGADRTRALYTSAEKGSWTAVNALTFLVGSRRAVLQAEIAGAEGRMSGLRPSDRAAVGAQVEQARAYEKHLGTGMQSLYAHATTARAHTSGTMIAKADELERRGQHAQAEKLRDDGARMAYAEAKYRAAMPKAHFDSAAVFGLAAEAQVAKGRAEMNAKLLENPPASLTAAANAGNGVPGAARLLEESRAANPGKPLAPAVLDADIHRTAALSDFHGRHLDNAKYFDRSRTAVSASPATREHRSAQLDAQATQLTRLGERIATLSGKTGPEDTLLVVRLHGERCALYQQLEGALGSAEASHRQLKAAHERRDEIMSAERSTRERQPDVDVGKKKASEDVVAANKDNQAVFGKTFRSDASIERDESAVRDATTIDIAATAGTSNVKASLERLAHEREGLDKQISGLAVADALDDADAQLVKKMLVGHPSLAPAKADTLPSAQFRSIRNAADRDAHEAQALIGRMKPTAEKAQLELGFARYHVQSAELDASAIGEIGRAGAIPRLDEAGALVDDADAIRISLSATHDKRSVIAREIIEQRGALAMVNGDYRPSVSVAQLDKAEKVADTDLRPDLAAKARESLGAVAVKSLERSDLRFDVILRLGAYDGKSQDALYAKAHRLLSNAPADSAARKDLAKIDAALDAAPKILEHAGNQISYAADVMGARVRAAGRSDVRAQQMQASTLATGVIYVESWGDVDLKEDVAKAGEAVTNQRVGFIDADKRRLTTGAGDLARVLTDSRNAERKFAMLGAIRIWSDRDNLTNVPAAYVRSLGALTTEVDMTGGGKNIDWQTFLRATTSGSGNVSPVARALGGPVLAFSPTDAASGGASLGSPTASMNDNYKAQLDDIKRTSDGMLPLMFVNLVGELAVATIATAGAGDIAVAKEGVDVVRAGRSGFQALEAARAASAAVQAAHPILHSVGVATAYGLGMAAASEGTHRLFGAHSDVSAAFDVAKNFAPTGAGDKALRLQLGLATASAAVTTFAVPALAEHFQVKSPEGQAAIGLALNAVLIAGVGALAARAKAPKPNETPAEKIERVGAEVMSELPPGTKLDDASTMQVVERIVERIQAEERGAVGDWAIGKLDPKHWSPEFRRNELLGGANQAAQVELKKLTAADLAAIYPEKGAIPWPLAALAGEVPGFGDFAKANPALARRLADERTLFAGLRADLLKNPPSAWSAVAQGYEARMPVVKPLPGAPGFVLVERGPKSPSWMPAVNLRPTRAIDHNGAFSVGGVRTDKTTAAPTALLDHHLVPRPDHMLVNVNGKLQPLPDANNVLVFSAHGSPFGFSGVNNRKGAELVVDQIVRARKNGQAMDYVVLDACYQRDARFFVGGSNAEAFQRAINQQLKSAGEAPIKVLAADKPGSLMGVDQLNSEWTFDDKKSPANYVPADEGSRIGVRPAHVVVGAFLAADAAGGGALIYRELTTDNEKRK